MESRGRDGRDSVVPGPTSTVPGPKGDPGKDGKYEAIHPWRWRLLTAWIIIFTVLVAKAIDDGNKTDETIQAERANNILLTCEATNERNKDTIQLIDDRVVELQKNATPEEQEEIQVQRDFTVALVNALAPYTEDCEEFVKQRVNPPKGKGIE